MKNFGRIKYIGLEMDLVVIKPYGQMQKKKYLDKLLCFCFSYKFVFQ